MEFFDESILGFILLIVLQIIMLIPWLFERDENQIIKNFEDRGYRYIKPSPEILRIYRCHFKSKEAKSQIITVTLSSDPFSRAYSANNSELVLF